MNLPAGLREVLQALSGRTKMATKKQALDDLVSDIDMEELASDPRFRSNGDRVTNREALIEKLSVRFRARSSEEWLEALGKAGMPCGLVQTIA